MYRQNKDLYEFGEFSLDAVDGVLMRGGRTVALAPKVFETLLVFVESDGRLLSKDELMNAVWQDSFVEESNLTQNIYTLRRIFGKRNKYIETVPRRGYRFIEPVVCRSKNDSSTSGTQPGSAAKSDPVLNEAKERNADEGYANAAASRRVFRSRRFNFGVLIGVVATLFVAAAVFAVWKASLPDAGDIGVQRVKLANLTDTGDVRHIALSPDGQFLAFIKVNDSDGRGIWLKDVSSKQELPLNVAEEFAPQFLNFSPDGGSIYFTSGRGEKNDTAIYKTSRFGGNAEFVAARVSSDFGVSPDGKWLAFYRQFADANSHDLVIVDTVDKTERSLKKQSFPQGFELRSAPAFSPDSKSLYTVVKPQANPVSDLIAIDIESGEETRFDLPLLRQVVSVSALSDGENLILAAREPNRFPQVYKLRTADRTLIRLTNDLNVYRKVSVSADGKNVVALQKTSASHVWLFQDANPAYSRQLTFGKDARDGRQGLAIMPDGKIVYTSLEDMNRDLWIIDPKDNQRRQLTVRRSDINERPFPSPDGEFIYFTSLQGDRYSIDRIMPDGRQTETLVSEDDANCLYPNISNDGKYLFFMKRSRGNSVVIQREIASGEEKILKIPDNFSPGGLLALSPDGRFLAFRQSSGASTDDPDAESPGPGRLGIVSVDEDLAKAREIVVSGSQTPIRWNEQSDGVFFIKNNLGSAEIWQKKIFSDTEPEKVFEFRGTTLYNFRYSSSNDLVLSQGRSIDDAILISDFH